MIPHEPNSDDSALIIHDSNAGFHMDYHDMSTYTENTEEIININLSLIHTVCGRILNYP